MSWNNPGGGGPWGGGGGKNPLGGFNPPDFEEFLRKAQERIRKLMPGGMGRNRGFIVVLAAVVLFWLASGFYRVEPDEEGIVLRFGAFDRTTSPGLNYHLPVPIEEAITPKVTRVNRIEIGYRSDTRDDIPQEALMLTGDENIVDINFTVFYLINNAQNYLFSIRDPDGTVKVAAESAMRWRSPARWPKAAPRSRPTPRPCCSRSSTAIKAASRSPRCSCKRSIRRSR